jgi:hypothetical protein
MPTVFKELAIKPIRARRFVVGQILDYFINLLGNE